MFVHNGSIMNRESKYNEEDLIYLIACLASGLEHALKFSSIPKKWPEQNKAFKAMVALGRDVQLGRDLIIYPLIK